jgi:4'-phosphopantetheinyl transferase EntD
MRVAMSRMPSATAIIDDLNLRPDSMMASLSTLLPADIAVVQKWKSAPLDSLSVEEQAMVSVACTKRKLEFATGRWCAREALKAKGIEGFSLLSDARRAPVWPSGIVGSITHTDGFCAAAIGLRDAYAGIGIDAELDGQVGEDLWSNLFTAQEIGWLERLPEPRRASMATVIFSAKESFYKAQYAFTNMWLDFTSATVVIENGRWNLHLVPPVQALERLRQPISGGYVISSRCVMTAIAIHTSEQTAN